MRILVADDNPFYRRLLEATLTEWNYEVEAVEDGAQAWSRLQSPDAPQIAILDWVMPGMDGPEICRRVRELASHEPTYLLVLTSKTGKESIVEALNAGADDYLTKPFDREELHARIRVGARVVGLQTSQTVIFAFAKAVESKSTYTLGHSERVTHYALGLGRAVGLSSSDLNTLRRGALVHDIGKIGIPDAILDKPGPLTDEEMTIVRDHPLEGFRMAERLHSCQELLPLIRWHHERLDGKGYPDGLDAPRIPLLVRILSVADVFDALASKRPYRAAMELSTCIRFMRENASGGGLDSALVEQFASIAAQLQDNLAAANSVSAQRNATDSATASLSGLRPTALRSSIA